MKQTAVEKFIQQLEEQGESWENVSIGRIQISIKVEDYFNLIEQAKELEKQQIIESGNSCAFKQHLHSERINKMSMDELEQYDLEPSYTFGEEYYNETFKNK
jgi:hypothetical protein